MGGPLRTIPHVNGHADAERGVRPATVTATPSTLRLMTVNVAHGRKRGPHQALQPKRRIRSNLGEVAAMLRQLRPDLVALQEADGPSMLTGRFDHVTHLADQAEYAFSFRGDHVRGKRLASGTALLSMRPLLEPVSVRFAPSPPTFCKGFVCATLDWPGNGTTRVDVVSVHFDFLRKSVRLKQVGQLVRHLADRTGPLIVMGDFNCQWSDRRSALRTLAEARQLRAYRPGAMGMKTFPKLGRRLDWVLISPELEFAEYAVVKATVSDHRPVACVVKLAGATA